MEPWQLSDHYTAEVECPRVGGSSASCRKQARIIYVDKAKPMERSESGSTPSSASAWVYGAVSLQSKWSESQLADAEARRTAVEESGRNLN